MKYGPDITAEIVGYITSGSNRTDSVTLAGISYETFSSWMKDHIEFNEAIKKAEASCKHRNIDLILKAATKSWQAAAWYLERKYPTEFALKSREDEQGKEIPQKMAERAAELLKKLEGGKPVASTNGNGVHS